MPLNAGRRMSNDDRRSKQSKSLWNVAIRAINRTCDDLESLDFNILLDTVRRWPLWKPYAENIPMCSKQLVPPRFLLSFSTAN